MPGRFFTDGWGVISSLANPLYFPLTYEWNTGQTGSYLSNLSVGTYVVTVTDSRNCSVVASETIDYALEITSFVQQACYGALLSEYGSVQLSVNGGDLPYQYNWSNGSNTSFINNLLAGQYEVTITDANGCEAYRRYNILNEMIFTTAYVDEEVYEYVSGCNGIEDCEDNSAVSLIYPVQYYPFDVFDPCAGGSFCCPTSTESCFDAFNGSTNTIEQIGPAPEYGDDLCWVLVVCTFSDLVDPTNSITINGWVYHYAYKVQPCQDPGLTGDTPNSDSQNNLLLSSPGLENSFLASIHPNPFHDTFLINFSTSISQRVNIV